MLLLVNRQPRVVNQAANPLLLHVSILFRKSNLHLNGGYR